MSWFAKFKTAYLQREIPLDVVVSTGSNLKVGQMVKLDKDTITAVTDATDKEALDSATHIIAQSDTSMEYGHVKVEDRDYRYTRRGDTAVQQTEEKADFPSGSRRGRQIPCENRQTAAAAGGNAHVCTCRQSELRQNDAFQPAYRLESARGQLPGRHG